MYYCFKAYDVFYLQSVRFCLKAVSWFHYKTRVKRKFYDKANDVLILSEFAPIRSFMQALLATKHE